MVDTKNHCRRIQLPCPCKRSSPSSSPKLNVPGLRFDFDNAKLIGHPERIGQVITVQGNETLIRELIRNFQKLEQISDANQIDYTAQKLRSRELFLRAIGLNLNTATAQKLQNLGLSTTPANAILKRRNTQPLRTLSEVLSLGEIDFGTYTQGRNRLITAKCSPSADLNHSIQNVNPNHTQPNPNPIARHTVLQGKGAKKE